MRVLIFDIEANGLLDSVTKVHCTVAKEYNSRQFCPFEVKDGDVIVGHNILGYDLEVLSRLCGTPYTIDLLGTEDTLGGKSVQFLDTYILSRLLNPDRDGHGLEDWGVRLGIHKPEVLDWDNLPAETYIHRCETDVRINEAVLDALLREAGQTVEQVLSSRAYQLEKAVQYIITTQEIHGVKFDSVRAEELLVDLDARMRTIEAEVEPQLPERDIPKSRLHTPPKVKFLKSGEPSKYARDYFQDLLFCEDEQWYVKYPDGTVPLAQADRPLVTKEPMRLANQSDIKDWLVSLGWNPTMYGERKDAQGNRIKMGPKFTDQNKNLCPDLLRMQDVVPLVKPVVKWLTYRNRRNVIKSTSKDTGWLNHPRLKVDGRLPSGADTIGAVTGRFTHRVVANVPRVTSDYGYEMRSLFLGEPYMVGWDAAALEARIEAHYTAKYDGGEYARVLLEADVHTRNAEAFGVDRNTAKTVKYAATYGARGKKLAMTIGCSEAEGNRIYEGFWESNPALRKVKENLVRIWKANGCKYIPGLDGRRIIARSEHSLLNSLFQSAGIICMKRAMVLMEAWWNARPDKHLAHGLIRYHDEEQWGVHESLVHVKKFLTKEEALGYSTSEGRLLGAVQEIQGTVFRAYCPVGELGVQSIRQAGVDMKLRVPLDGEYKVGRNWAQTH